MKREREVIPDGEVEDPVKRARMEEQFALDCLLEDFAWNSAGALVNTSEPGCESSFNEQLALARQKQRLYSSQLETPKFMKSVPQRTVPVNNNINVDDNNSTGRERANSSNNGGTCIRYTLKEEQALVHAKMRMQLAGIVGVNTETEKLADYYEYYLKLLAPADYLRYPKREVSALVRKFKAIKQKSPQLMQYLDPDCESGFWRNLIELVNFKPLLHPLFYGSNPSKEINSVCPYIKVNTQFTPFVDPCFADN